jgi:putative transposase
LRVEAGLHSLRGCKMFRALHGALAAGNERPGFRLVEYSVQQGHFHLIVEAKDAASLSRAVQGLAIRLARTVNRTQRRTGRVFADRYRSRLIRGSRDARNTLRYVLNNARRHVRFARRNPTRWTDPCSSAPWFRKWSVPRGVPDFTPDRRHATLVSLGSAAVPSVTRLLTSGWARAGPIELLHIPGPVAASR